MQRQAAILPTAMGLPTRYDAALAEDRRLAADTSAQAAQTTERRRQLAVLAAQELRAQADIEARQAQLDLAKIRLGYTVLRAPEDGVVGARQVRVGTLLEPGSAVVPFTRLQNVWITANFTERQLTDILPGQAAYVRMDTYPDVELRAHVDGISPLTGTQLAAIPADNATGNYTKVVQRVPVKIVLDDISPLAGRIRPGMSALVRIDTASHSYVRPAR
jgi:membrane fusion protein (multidrug efflux system)